MLQRRVLESRDQGALVGGNVRAGRHLQGGRGVIHHAFGEAAIARVAHRVGHGLIACQIPQVGERRVTAIEQTQFHVLVRRDVSDELRTRDRPVGPHTPGKAVLDHPLAERLGDDRGGIVDAEPRRDRSAIAVRRRRRDAIHHRGREGDLVANKVCELRIHELGKACHDARDGAAVVREVVAA
jgi:hypothetical protein